MFRLNTDELERHSEVEHHHVASTSFEGSHGKLLEFFNCFGKLLKIKYSILDGGIGGGNFLGPGAALTINPALVFVSATLVCVLCSILENTESYKKVKTRNEQISTNNRIIKRRSYIIATSILH
ncbi:hypothetical protein NQ317_008406 [Molorchus minor]|uniref:Uncharacterized protein n=1 Tax=Molorchus minor TaxID=1323400 RepID=A0ABQ9K768_9CUCU|nr:hypothetical protein NQ317_008406 [Molorchus minor]